VGTELDIEESLERLRRLFAVYLDDSAYSMIGP
jgi:hypothetical protein